MKSRTISLKKLRKLLILQQIQMNLQNQSQVIQRILFGYPQVEKLTLLRALEPTPQRRKVNCFQQNTSISWWPRFGTKLIRRSRQLFLITRRVRRPVSRLTWKTLRRLGMQKQTTKAMVKSEKANSLSVSFSHLQNWGCSAVLLTHISIYWIYSVDMVDLFFFLCYLFPPHRLCIILVFTCHFQLNHSLFFILSNIFLLTDKSTTKYPGGVCVFILFIFQVRTLWDSNVLTFVATGLIKEWVDM